MLKVISLFHVKSIWCFAYAISIAKTLSSRAWLDHWNGSREGRCVPTAHLLGKMCCSFYRSGHNDWRLVTATLHVEALPYVGLEGRKSCVGGVWMVDDDWEVYVKFKLKFDLSLFDLKNIKSFLNLKSEFLLFVFTVHSSSIRVVFPCSAGANRPLYPFLFTFDTKFEVESRLD